MGTGQFAKKHINLWKKFSNVKVIGFYSHNNSDILNLKKYSNIEELIKDSDIVDLVTQNHLYHEVIKKIFKQRKNFVVEKIGKIHALFSDILRSERCKRMQIL